jgi:hypothetical protein
MSMSFGRSWTTRAASRRIPPLLLLLLSSACFPWPVRSRAFYPNASVGEGKEPRVGAGIEYVFERCRGIFTHPVLSGHCLYLTVRRDLVTAGRELSFPGDGTQAVLSTVGMFQRHGAAGAPTGRMRIREVRPDRIVADVDVSGVGSDGEWFVVRDRIGFRLTEVGADTFSP